ncbi:hypothetical protein CHS0354_015241 [Potamilus streckersoni]|uniref:Uncharacterized protein n=1 Tax=Potamilus streckersoni TaxID=2493646 RepID=A0AAE0VHU8_9BIVA|nr:hypothetical protein CHS0354_015241 [Potamilus streckersoni]
MISHHGVLKKASHNDYNNYEVYQNDGRDNDYRTHPQVMRHQVGNGPTKPYTGLGKRDRTNVNIISAVMEIIVSQRRKALEKSISLSRPHPGTIFCVEWHSSICLFMYM